MKQKQKQLLLIISIILSCLGIIAIFFPYNILNNSRIGDYVIHIGDYNELGDFISGVSGPILSLAAFLLLYLTYRLQSNELSETKILLKQQSIISIKQKFENTFFNLLQVHKQIKDSISLNTSICICWNMGDKPPVENISSNRVFEFAKQDYTNFYYNNTHDLQAKDLIDKFKELKDLGDYEEIKTPLNEPIKRIKETYTVFFESYHNQFSHYFRHLYYILEFIEKEENYELQNNISDKDSITKNFLFYAGILQSQFTSSEMFLIFYNGICFPNLKRLIDKYNLLENLCIEDLIDEKNHKNLYENPIFKSRKFIVQN